ncbi:MAG: protein kinase, partial [Frankia sp.]|nr:protein kinase [Frankia sp.]
MSGEGRPTLDAGRLDGFAVRESGTVIGGRYRLEGVLGEGGMGVVHRATDQLLRRTVAIKQVRLPGGTGPRTALARERVLREARAAGRLHHPGAVGVLDVIDDGELPWIVMELVEGESLATLVQRTGGLPVERVARIGISLAYALEAAHKIGVIHRDVKPSNVIVTEAGQARLTDFGIAVSHGDDRLTGTGEVVGSPAYLAPERAHGEAGGPPSDVWGLGATLYHAVEGEPPFGGDSALAILTAVVEGRRRPAMRAGRITPILEAMLQADEAARPSLGIVRARLRDAAEEAPLRPSQARARLTAPKPAAAAAASPPGAAAAPPPAPGQAAAGAQPPVGQPVPLAPEATVPLTEEEAAALVDEETVALRDEPADEQPSAGSPSAEAATTVATPPPAGQPHADAAGQPGPDAAGQPGADAAGAPADTSTPPAAGAAAEAAPAPAGPPPADPLTPTLPEQTQALGEPEPAVGDMTTVAWGAPGPGPSAPTAGPGEQAAAGLSLRPRPLDRMRALGGIPGLARPDDAAGGTRGA